jgi:uncharacterized protein GlcG (DUF336 family)
MFALTLDQACTIIDAALRRGRELNLAPLTVVVLDPGGHMVALKREDGSGILRVEIATGKAWGGLGLGVGSRELFERSSKMAGFFGAMGAVSQGRLVPVPGGVLVRDPAGAIIGAVGISGDVSDQDEVCAIAGVEAAGLSPDRGGSAG